MVYLGQVLTTTVTSTTGYTSPDLDVHNYRGLQVDVVLTGLTAGSSPGITATLKRKDANGHYNALVTSASATNTTTNAAIVLSFGPGYSSDFAVGNLAQLVIAVAGTPTGISYDISVAGE